MRLALAYASWRMFFCFHPVPQQCWSSKCIHTVIKFRRGKVVHWKEKLLDSCCVVQLLCYVEWSTGTKLGLGLRVKIRVRVYN